MKQFSTLRIHSGENKVKKYIGVNKIIFELARRKTSVFLHITRKIPHSIVSQNQYFSVRARFNSASLAKQSVPSIANFTPSPPVRQTSGSLTGLNGKQFFPKKLVKLNSKYHICPQEFFFLFQPGFPHYRKYLSSYLAAVKRCNITSTMNTLQVFPPACQIW